MRRTVSAFAALVAASVVLSASTSAPSATVDGQAQLQFVHAKLEPHA